MAAKYPDPSLPWPIIVEGVRLLAEKERCVLKAYPDPISKGKPWTIGWGETDGVSPGDVWTQGYADKRLCAELTTYASKVVAMCTGPTDDYELAALTVLAYNIGLRRDRTATRPPGGLYHSSVLRLHNAGKKNEAARAFLAYNKARNEHGVLVEVNGLTTRRMAEAALYLTPTERDHEPMAQAVETPRSLAKSPTVLTGSAATVAGGALTTAAVSLEPSTLAEWGATLERFGIQPIWALGAIIMAFGLIVVYRRFAQHQNGIT